MSMTGPNECSKTKICVCLCVRVCVCMCMSPGGRVEELMSGQVVKASAESILLWAID